MLRLPRYARVINGVCHVAVLLLSLSLIVFISYDTFAQINFLENGYYMTFQFWVCIIFLSIFCLELTMAPKGMKWDYIKSHWFFFLISIPYLNLINLTRIELDPSALYYLRFIPLIRGAYSLAMVVGAISSNRALSLLASYAAILLSIIYFASLIFYYKEYTINPGVDTYWSALWWAGMNVTTIGCDINPMTVAGKVCAVSLAACGMLMLPLFTVYVTDRVKSYNERRRHQENAIIEAFHTEEAKPQPQPPAAAPAPDASRNSK